VVLTQHQRRKQPATGSYIAAQPECDQEYPDMKLVDNQIVEGRPSTIKTFKQELLTPPLW
jgi:hypothetical protein